MKHVEPVSDTLNKVKEKINESIVSLQRSNLITTCSYFYRLAITYSGPETPNIDYEFFITLDMEPNANVVWSL